MRTCLPALAILGLGAASAAAVPVVLQNDSVTDFSQVSIQAGFVANEKGAAWLTATCSGDLTHVQVYWASITGGSGDTLGQSLEIFSAGTFPIPGPRLLELLGPVVTDGFLNEFPIVPPIPLTSGETIVFSFQFLNDPPIIGPSLVTDTNGCQAGRNGIFAIPPSLWLDACALGVSGDLVLRAVVDCPAGPLFTDGFESGDTTAWDVTIP